MRMMSFLIFHCRYTPTGYHLTSATRTIEGMQKVDWSLNGRYRPTGTIAYSFVSFFFAAQGAPSTSDHAGFRGHAILTTVSDR